MINYREAGCNDDCRECDHNIIVNGKHTCDLKMIDLTGTPFDPKNVIDRTLDVEFVPEKTQ